MIAINSSDDEDISNHDEGDHVSEPPEKKVRVSSAAVHNEFEESKDKTGCWTSKCRHCLIKDKIYKHKNSSALLIHLEKNHPAVHKKCVEDDRKERQSRESVRKDKELQVKSGGSSYGHTTAAQALFSSQKLGMGQQSGGPIDKYMQGIKQSLPGWKQRRINQKFAFWLGASGLPISAVTEDPHFKDFVSEMNPEVKLPSRGKVMKDCSVLCVEVQAKIKSALEKANKVSVTTDIWSSTKCKNSYLGLTVHLFNHDTKRRESYRIACRKFDVSHTGENIARQINSILSEYGVESNVLYCLSEDGGNMKKGLRLISEDS